MLSLKNLFAGNFSRKILYKHVIPSLMINFSFWMFLSVLSYDGFDWRFHDISFLGHPNRTTWFGVLTWSIAMISLGIFQVPIFSFLRKNLIVLNKFYKDAAILTMYIGSIGTIGLGLFPQGDVEIAAYLHAINAILAFGGLALGILILLFLMLLKKDLRKYTIFPLMFSFALVAVFTFTQVIRTLEGFPIRSLEYWYCSLSFWEWTLFIGILIVMGYLIYITKFEPFNVELINRKE